MSDRRDCWNEMSRFHIDDSTAERLLLGEMSPEDAPPGYAGLAGMVRAATGPADPTELASEANVVSAVVAAVRSAPSNRLSTHRRTPMLAKLLSAKITAVAVTTALGAAAAAAATGNLPNSAQSAVSGALSHVGISVLKSSSHASVAVHGQAEADHVASADHEPSPAGPNAKADFGQCTAFMAGSEGSPKKDHSTAFADLIADHGGSVKSTTTYCQGVIAAKEAGHDSSAASSTDHNAGAGQGNGSASASGAGAGAGVEAGAGLSGQTGSSPGQSAGHKPADPGPNAQADFGQCTAFMAGQQARTNVHGNAKAGTGKDSSSAFADLIAKHGGTAQSATVYCQAVIAAH